MTPRRPRLHLWQILNMNAGFFGIQFSFGLQQSNMSPIYTYLGAHDGNLPYLWLAGPVTGLIVQPLIGVLSDRTDSRLGRRTPYFLVGALVCSLCLLAMPFSRTLWMAASLLWILDAANNVAMEPYRAFVNDRLDPKQHTTGFLTQSAFTGLSQTLAYLTPSLLVLLGMNLTSATRHGIPYVVVSAFVVGALFSVASVGWSAWTTPELPLSDAERARIRSQSRTPAATVREIVDVLHTMPVTMRRLAVMMLFQWYAMFCYWEYITLSLTHTLYGGTDAAAGGFDHAVLISGRIGGFYNAIAFVAALAMVPLAKRVQPQKLHAACLLLGGAGLMALPQIHDPWLLLVPMLGLGLAWASMMGNPYAMLAGVIPPERAGVYMGIFNGFVVLPMIVQVVTLPLLYPGVLDANPQNVIRLAGAGLMLAAMLAMRVRELPARSH